MVPSFQAGITLFYLLVFSFIVVIFILIRLFRLCLASYFIIQAFELTLWRILLFACRVVVLELEPISFTYLKQKAHSKNFKYL
jgi:hypothetical protein